jgi:hypothetical protein
MHLTCRYLPDGSVACSRVPPRAPRIRSTLHRPRVDADDPEPELEAAVLAIVPAAATTVLGAGRQDVLTRAEIAALEASRRERLSVRELRAETVSSQPLPFSAAVKASQR